ncbi:unnamed protein product [Adineta steineri]|uniref:Uncharacterized protein n=1 Tax=Adineta steineri TaxID=433720 RepID=A0A816DI09_9BILA|nr:unnamed protein product [Adineta steineri]CAF1637645.1 unnamed protein product [Adineta steineri]
MSNTNTACRRICCCRKSKLRPTATTIINNESSSSPKDKKMSNNQSINEIMSTSNFNDEIQSDIDLDRLTKQCLETINEYRFQLGFSSLKLSSELTNRALDRATQLSVQNYIENTTQFDLVHNNEPIGETVMSCQAPANDGSDIARLIHDELIDDFENDTLHTNIKSRL